jgi:hypothetical protein
MMTSQQLEARDYSLCTALYRTPLRWHEFLVGTAVKAERESRARAYALAHWGEPAGIDIYPRNYIKQARTLFAVGKHD